MSQTATNPTVSRKTLAQGLATVLDIPLRPPTGHHVRWRGQLHPLRFGSVELELSDDRGEIWRWPANAGLSPASMRDPILGTCGCLQFFDALFRGEDRMVETVIATAAAPR